MHDRAAVLRPVDQGDVFLDAIEGLHLEAPPVGPQCAADAFGGQAVGHLVGLHAVVEGGDPEAELAGQVDHGGDLVGAVAVDMDQDVAIDRTGQGVQLEVALAAGVAGAVALAGLAGLPPLALGRLRRGLAAAVPAPVLAGIDEGGAIAGHVAHARGRGGALAAVDALGVLAAGHLQAPGRAGKLHRLITGGRHVAQGHPAAADQVGRAGQDLQGGDATGQGRGEARVLRPHRVFGPDVGGDRGDGLVAIAVRLHARARVDAQVRMHVDDARGDPLAAGIDHARGRIGLQAGADLDDPAVTHQHVGPVQALAGAGEHGGVAQQHRFGGQRLVGARIGVVGEARGGRGGWRNNAGGGADDGQARRGERQVAHGFSPDDAEPRS